ncbi:MAG TPA: VOC family protein [Acidimicrobiales bacterium]|jgi:hypothetical protein|nr:VOC family protein [Acidimicrobiales bacterium]
MPTRDHAPLGSPCWADLWTSDVEGSRRFYAGLFGWEATAPEPQFGGYFTFTRDGVPVAGAMGDMGDMRADDTWKIYLTTADAAATAEAARAAGADVVAPPMAVADLGIQTVMQDPTGAPVGAWQAGTFPGFTVLDEHGAPGWFELHTRDHAGAVAFYQSVFGWETKAVGDSDQFRYSTMQNPEAEGELAGIMDASFFLPDGAHPYWTVYWTVDDADAAVASVNALGGSLVAGPEDTPYGRIATVADSTGAVLRLRVVPE